ncbi:tetratricopeptide repeat protein [Geitlerinema sp. CS-897]|nr:tetratricopeptide repeat protein [Geitlerinema sp. CS-897]
MKRLDELFSKTDKVAITAVAGMGGIGKTELALQWASRQLKQKRYPGGVCWIDVKSRNVAEQIVQFCQIQFQATMPEELTSIETRLDYCWRNWERWQAGTVLLVFDDVERDRFAEDVQPYLPVDAKFQALLTTRDVWSDIESLSLEVLSLEDARKLFAVYVKDETRMAEASVDTLLDEFLGRLPLGVELAGRYLALDEYLSVADYLEELKAEKLKHESIAERDAEMQYPNGIEAAIRLSWRKLEAAAQSVAMRLGLYASAPIPLTEEQVKQWRKPLKALVNLHLLQRPSRDVVRLHPLVRQFVRSELEASAECDVLKREVAAAVTEQGKGIPYTITREQVNEFEPWIPHLQEVAETLLDWVADEDIIWSYRGFAWFYQGQGFYEMAKLCHQSCVSVAKQRLGDRHPHTAATINNLANLYLEQGDYKEAEFLFSEALTIARKALPSDSPQLASHLNNLASLYMKQGRYEKATPLFLEALEIKCVLPSNHPDLATGFDNLANLYRSQGKYEEATSMYLNALSIARKAVPPNYPQVASVLNGLANLYLEQKKYEEAEPFSLEALAIARQTLPPNHPQLASNLNSQASLSEHQGKYEDAKSLYLEALAIARQTLPPNHPQLASNLNNLANLYRKQRKYEEAEPLYLEAVTITRKVLSPKHPQLATILHNLANLYREQGKYKEAEPLYLEAINIFFKSLGVSHPNTYTVWIHCLNFYREAFAAGLPDTRLRQHPLGETILAQLNH